MPRRKKGRRKESIEESWLAVAQPARRALHDLFDFDDLRSDFGRVAAVLILNSLAERTDCPKRFAKLANPKDLPAEGPWGRRAKTAYTVLTNMTLGPPVSIKKKKKAG